MRAVTDTLFSALALGALCLRAEAYVVGTAGTVTLRTLAQNVRFPWAVRCLLRDVRAAARRLQLGGTRVVPRAARVMTTAYARTVAAQTGVIDDSAAGCGMSLAGPCVDDMSGCGRTVQTWWYSAHVRRRPPVRAIRTCIRP